MKSASENNRSCISIISAGEELILHPERGLFWGREKMLLISDLHLGKSHTFRHHGISIPEGTTRADLVRLERLCQITQATSLWILGDVIHAHLTDKPEQLPWLSDWLNFRKSQRDLRIVLVKGNHDREILKNLLQLDEEFSCGVSNSPFYLTHDPKDKNNSPISFVTISGHLHPAVKLPSLSRSVPAFVVDPTQIILPAFSSFTGGHPMRWQPDRKFYLCAENEIIRLNK